MDFDQSGTQSWYWFMDGLPLWWCPVQVWPFLAPRLPKSTLICRFKSSPSDAAWTWRLRCVDAPKSIGWWLKNKRNYLVIIDWLSATDRADMKKKHLKSRFKDWGDFEHEMFFQSFLNPLPTELHLWTWDPAVSNAASGAAEKAYKGVACLHLLLLTCGAYISNYL